MEKLYAWLQSIHPICPALWDQLAAITKVRKLKMRQYLLKAGDIANEFCFVESGAFTVYYIQNEREICSRFIMQAAPAASVHSFFNQVQSIESIHAMENCVVLSASYAELENLCLKFPQLNAIARLYLQQSLMQSAVLLNTLRKTTASERYQTLMALEPELVLRVPGKYIASYLGMAEVTLSMVKGRIAEAPSAS